MKAAADDAEEAPNTSRALPDRPFAAVENVDVTDGGAEASTCGECELVEPGGPSSSGSVPARAGGDGVEPVPPSSEVSPLREAVEVDTKDPLPKVPTRAQSDF